MSMPVSRDDVAGFVPDHETFVGIDSDGCVFDTMPLKQKKCFHGGIISQWRLEPIERYVRETAEFVGLYSTWRGTNRYPALCRVFELLAARPEVERSGVGLPDMTGLREFVESGVPLGLPALREAVDRTGDGCLADVLTWSTRVNTRIERVSGEIRPFRWARECLAAIAASSDAMCVSQTPSEALEREWQGHDLARYVRVIAGQELGTKTEHLRLATRGKYGADKALMIGDAPGDLRAAREAGLLFWPINPGGEDQSWERFLAEGHDRFLAGTYAGRYEAARVKAFEALLPDRPPWEEGRA